jgi:hypothetical protein
MYLSKRSGIYYLWFTDANGKKQKRSTGVTTKTEAVKFLRAFNEEEARRRRALQSISVDAFKDAYVSFSRGVHTPNSVESNASAFRVFAEYIGGQTALRSITPADCEKFLAKKAEKVGPHTLLRLYRTL